MGITTTMQQWLLDLRALLDLSSKEEGGRRKEEGSKEVRKEGESKRESQREPYRAIKPNITSRFAPCLVNGDRGNNAAVALVPLHTPLRSTIAL